MTIQSLSGPVTSTEISSYETFMAGQAPPTANTYDNNIADGTAGMNCESLGLMYEVTNDPALLNEMITYADAFISLRNDFTDQRVMWDGNVDPVWLTKAATASDAGYAGCENNDIVGHIAYCAKLILETPSLWNQTVPDGNPHGYGVTYFQRATNYVAQMEFSEDNYFTKWFIDTSTDRIKDSTAVDPRFSALGESTTAFNRQMMFMNGWQRLSECHQILGDNPTKVVLYNSIVQAAINWFVSQLQPGTASGRPVYNWTYAPNGSGSEDNTLHSTYDIWGITRAYNAGLYTNIGASTMIPFANTLQYVMNVSTNHISYYVNGTSSPNSPRSFIYPGWMPIANFGPTTYSIMANMNIAQGSQGSTAIFDAFILWDKNARATGFYASNNSAADYFLNSPWIEQVNVGGNANYPVTVNSLFGFGSGVTISVNGLPSGVSASVSPGYNATITLTASSSAAAGIYSATVSGSGGGITRTVPIIVDVVASQTPDFTISATPTSQGVSIGGSTTYTVNIGAVNGFSGSVSLSGSGLPTGASAGFNPGSVSGSGSSTLTITTSSSTPSGTYTVTVTGTSGSLTHNATVTLAVSDFTISTTPSSQTVTAGNNTNYTVNLGNVNGFSGTVTFTASGLPTGASASFNPTSATAPGSSTLTVSTSASTAAGTYTVTVTGTSGSLQHSTSVRLIINAAQTWTEVNDTDPSITYSAGWNYSTNRNDGDFNNDVHYTKTNGNYAQFTFTGTAIQYITETFTDESNVDIYIDNTYQTTVNCYSATRAAQVVAYSNTALSAGSHTIKIVKNGGTYMLLDAFAYTAVAVPNFSVSVSPSSQTVTAGNGTSYTATITPVNGFNGMVNLSVSGLPSGASGSFNPTSVSGSGSSTLTVTTATSTAPGTYTLTITGISGTLTNSTTATLVVNAAPDFSIAASPSAQTVAPGASTNYTATISALNGFNGGVGLTVSGLPSGATGTFNPTSVTGSGSLTLTVATTTSTPIGTNTLTITGTSGSLVHSTTVTLIVNTNISNSNIAPSGTAYGWSGMTSSTANTGKAALPGLNDNNLTVNVDIQPNGDSVNAWEAAGVIWSSTRTITSVDFINGDITSGGDGFLTANLKLQFSTDGSTWTDSGWTVSPSYPYSSSAGGKTYTFSGAAVTGKLGARVIGQVRTTDTSYHWIVKEVQITGH